MRLRPVHLCLFLAARVCGAAEIPEYDFRKPLRDGVIAVGMECHKKNRTLELGLFYPNKPPSKRMDLWLTRDLVHYDPDSLMVTEVLELERQCTIGDDRYRVRLRGLPGAANANWICGAVVTAEAQVWKNDRLIFDEELDRCSGGKAIRIVRFSHGSDEPEIEHFER
jgi:hypothetical protein